MLEVNGDNKNNNQIQNQYIDDNKFSVRLIWFCGIIELGTESKRQIGFWQLFQFLFFALHHIFHLRFE